MKRKVLECSRSEFLNSQWEKDPKNSLEVLDLCPWLFPIPSLKSRDFSGKNGNFLEFCLWEFLGKRGNFFSGDFVGFFRGIPGEKKEFPWNFSSGNSQEKEGISLEFFFWGFCWIFFFWEFLGKKWNCIRIFSLGIPRKKREFSWNYYYFFFGNSQKKSRNSLRFLGEFFLPNLPNLFP